MNIKDVNWKLSWQAKEPAKDTKGMRSFQIVTTKRPPDPPRAVRIVER